MSSFDLFIICLTVLLVAVLTSGTLVRLTENRSPAVPAAGSDAAPPRIGSRVVVHTKQPDDQSIRGIIAAEYKDRLSLIDAEYVTTQGRVPIGGVQDIDPATIAWIEVYGLVADEPDPQPAEK